MRALTGLVGRVQAFTVTQGCEAQAISTLPHSLYLMFLWNGSICCTFRNSLIAWGTLLGTLLKGQPCGMMVVRLNGSLTTLSRKRVPGLLWWQLPCSPVLGQNKGRPHSFVARASKSSTNGSLPFRAACRGLLLQKTLQPHF